MARPRGSRGPERPSPRRRWPIFRSFAGYRLADLPRDLAAGLTLAAIAIPEQMATARLAGLSPETGFFAFLAGSLAFAVFGANRVLSCGADSTIAPIFAGGLALLATAGSPDYSALAAALALMVGLGLVAGGLFRLGWIADLLSIPVTTGFLAGISAHIFISQLPTVLALPHQSGPLISHVLNIVDHLGDANFFTLAIGLGVLAIIALSEALSARIPGALIGLAAATGAVVGFGLEKRGVAVVGAVPGRWPGASIPLAPLGELAHLILLGLLIALVVMVQTAATTRAFPSDPDEPPDVDGDFIGVGAGGILAGLVGAFPVNASPPRTGIASETGGRSQLTGLVAAAIAASLLAFGGQLLARIPSAALAGVLLFVSFRLVRISQIAAVCRESIPEFLLIIATCAAIVVTPIEQGVAVGVALSLLHGIWSITRARLIVLERVPGTSIWWPPAPRHRGETLPHTLVLAFQAPLSFLNADRLRRDILEKLRNAPDPLRLVVLEASAIPEIDFTAAQALRGLIRRCRKDHIDFAIARLESVRAQEAAKRFRILDALGPGRVFHSVDEAMRALGPQARAALPAPTQSRHEPPPPAPQGDAPGA